jgi:hypothetical protein
LVEDFAAVALSVDGVIQTLLHVWVRNPNHRDKILLLLQFEHDCEPVFRNCKPTSLDCESGLLNPNPMQLRN